MLRLAIVVNEPPPYRIPVFNLVARTSAINLQVIFCCRREPNRLWDLPDIAFDHVFLKERIRTVKGRYIHNNPDVLLALGRFQPDVILGNGFNPTHLYAFAWARLMRRAYVAMTDGTLQSEQALSQLHKRLRHYIYRRARAFIAASQGGMALYRSYDVPTERCFQSCLAIDNSVFQPQATRTEKIWDFLFCGRLEEAKRPEFAIDVALQSARKLGRKTSLLVVGSGSQEVELRRRAETVTDELSVHFHGFARQADLPALYRSAKIFLFPTRADVWGVVANEACAAGLPVIVSPHAGVADELIVNGHNGFVRPLDIDAWTDCAVSLLDKPEQLQAMGERALLLVQPYHFQSAAQGIVDACRAAQANDRVQPDDASVRRPV
jgi:glycosyltransferase involved in cell wall biosynthesis